MSIFESNVLLGALKKILKNTIYRPGTVTFILTGPLKGYKYRVTDNTGWAQIYGGWKPEAQRVLSFLLKQGQVVYDIGASVGVMALLFSRLVGNQGKVFAFEPLPGNVKEIESLKLLNKVSNIYVVNKAIGNYEGKATLYLTDDNNNNKLFFSEDSNGKTIQSDITTLDNLAQNGLEPANLIKIDTLGSELEVLEGFLRSINEHHPAFIIMLYKPSNDAKIGRFFQEHGYSIFRLNNDFARKFAKQRRPVVEILHPERGWPAPEGTCGHILALHLDRHSKIIDSLRSSRPFNQ